MEAAKPKPIIGALAPVYDRTVPLAYTLVRLTVGLMLLPHGIPKVQQGIEAFAQQSIAGRGLKPALLIAYLVVFNETIGAVMIAVGLLTRVVAFMVAVEMAVIVYVYWPKFGWTQPGYEYVLMWGLMAFALVLGGGGRYSLDHYFGREV
jgi:putative oxidoreductase